MKKWIVFFPGLLFCLCSFGQDNMFWVHFKDKNHNSFSLSNPQQFLSQQSINRRANQGLSLDSTDLPVSQVYMDSISRFINRLAYTLKWENLAIVQINNPDNIDSIRRFSFVDSVNAIEYTPSRSVQKNDKMEDVFPPVDQEILSPSKLYGNAYNQIRMLNGDLLHQLGYRGQGITIAMMDNGQNNANNIHAFDSVRPRILLTWDFVHNRRDVYSDGGHGTNTFGCIAGNIPGQYLGTAPDANFFLFQTEQNDAEWVMEEYNWVAAAEMADSAGAQIFTTSLGYTTFDGDSGSNTYADLTGDKTVMTHAANQAFGKGILVLNSAGNDGQDSWHYIAVPADGDSVLTIGAVDPNDTIAGFSSRGPNAAGQIKPDVCAQGVGSWVITITGSTGTSSGTSFSCPITAGCAASLWSAFPNRSARDIKDAIVISADRFWNPDNNYGYGIPNFYTAYLLLKTNYDVNEISPDRLPTVFPNPFTDQLNVSLYSTETQSHFVEIFDMLGRRVYYKTIFVRSSTYEISTLADVEGIAEGYYILRLDGNKSFSFPLLKLK